MKSTKMFQVTEFIYKWLSSINVNRVFADTAEKGGYLLKKTFQYGSILAIVFFNV